MSLGIAHVTEKSRSTSVDLMWRRSYTRVYTVETLDPSVGPLAVRQAVDPATGVAIPQPGAYYITPAGTYQENDHGAWVIGVEASLDDLHQTGGIQWTVTVSYGPFDTSAFGNDPTQWAIKVNFGGERTDRVLYFDQYGNPITNSAGDPFDPPITIDDSRSILTVTRNELVSSYNFALAEMYRDTINQYTWNGFAPYTAKLGIISTSDPQYSSAYQVYYYTVTYPFTIKRDGWQVAVLDAGCNELTGPYGAYYPYTDQKTRPIMNGGQQVSDPVPLNGYGQRLPVGGIPITLVFEGYSVTDFTGLGINLSLALGM